MPETAEQLKQQEADVLHDVASIQADVAREGALVATEAARQNRATHFAKHWLSFIVQGVFYPFFYIGYHACFSLRIHGKEKLKDVKGPVIFVANHIGVFDSFIFDLFVPPFSAIPPFRFMGTSQFKIAYLNVLKYLGIVSVIYWLFGVFKVTYGKGVDVALIPAYEIIRNGGTVAIFPEGRVWRYDRYGRGVGEKEPIGPFKWGAAVLAKNTGVLVVPVAFNQHPRNMFRDYIDVRIGEPYRVDKTKTAETLTEDMQLKVQSLFNKQA